MAELQKSGVVERVVGLPRHPTIHQGRLVGEDDDAARGEVWILHSQQCLDNMLGTTGGLQACEYSRALDGGINLSHWQVDVSCPVVIDELGELRPA